MRISTAIQKFILFILIIIATAMFAAVVLAFGIYFLGWHGAAVQTFARIVPLPVAQVNGRYIPLRKLSPGKSVDELIESELVRQIAQSYGVKTRDELEIALVKARSDAEIRAARAAISAGGDFAEVARQYSDDEESRYIGGDLGFLVVEDLPVWMRAAIEPLAVGQTSGIVAGPDGFHIYQIRARDDESFRPRKQIRQIFIKADGGFDKLVEQKIQSSKIYVFGKFKQ